jgi:ABC-type enterochelin transport system permease subunit
MLKRELVSSASIYIMAYLSGSLLLTAGLLPLTGLVICGLLARLIVTHCVLTDLVSTQLIPELLRLTKQFFNRLVLCLLEKPRHMITLTNPELPAWLSKEGGSITKH